MPRPKIHQSDAEKQAAYRERQRLARIAELQAKGIPAHSPIPTIPSNARWNKLIEQAKANLETCRDEMQTYFDERNEQWQESERGESIQAKIESIEEIIENLQNN